MMKSTNATQRFIAAPLFIAVSTANFALAEEAQTFKGHGLEEVVVTAEKRDSDLQNTAMAVGILSGDDAIKRGSVSLDDLLKDMVGVQIQPIGFGSAVNIRGMGWDLPVDVGQSAVTVNYDGAVNANTQASLFGFYDLNRVEVLRGPQGTLYGQNATAGTVNVITADPSTDEISGYALGEVGNYSLRRVEGAINLPLSDTMAIRIAASDIDRDGYMSTGAGDADGTAVRGKFLYEPTDDLKIKLIGEYNKIGGISPDTNTPISFYDAGEPYFSVVTSPDQEYDYKFYKYAADIQATIGNGILTILPSYQESDQAGTTFFPPIQQVIDNGDDNIKQKAIEVRYGSLPEAEIQWTTGIYYYDKEQALVAPFGPCAALGCDRGNGSEAIFAQMTYPFTESTRLTIGGRYSKDKVSLAQKNMPEQAPFYDAEVEFSNFTYRIALESDLTENSMGYASVSTAIRPGGFNVGVNVDSNEFQEEEVTSYELGYKSRWMEDRLQVNGALFYYDYENYQTVDAAGDPFVDPAGFYVSFFNAASATNMGLELETVALVTDTTKITFGVGYLDATYSSDFYLHLLPWEAPINLKDEPLPRSPEWTFKLGIDQQIPIGSYGVLTAGINARHLSDHKTFAIETPTTIVDAYGVIDATLNFAPNDGSWSINAWVKNAGDKVYKVSGGTNNVIAGAPQMYGVNFRYNF